MQINEEIDFKISELDYFFIAVSTRNMVLCIEGMWLKLKTYGCTPNEYKIKQKNYYKEIKKYKIS